jgi:hypothetical protein
VCSQRQRPALWPASRFCGWRRLAQPASSAELDFTRGTVTLVVAPEEHPFPIGLGSKREARCVAEPTRRHATPLTEALHVPLHLERWCCVANGRPVQIDTDAGQAPLFPGLAARGRSLQRFCVSEHSGSGRERAERVLVKIRELLAAVPSSSASLSAILQSLLCAFSPHKAELTGNPAKSARGPEFVVRYAPAQASSGPVRHCTQAWLIWLTNG